MNLAVVGDMHGHASGWEAIVDALAEVPDLAGVWQAGDFGFRFKPAYLAAVQAVATRLGVPVHWVDGNHDNHEVIAAARRENWTDPIALWPETAPDVLHVPRGGIVEMGGRRVMGVGGAQSTDVNGRSAHLDWWRGETLSMAETYRAMDAAAAGADIMVCHDTPTGTEPGVADGRFARYNVPDDIAALAMKHRDALAVIADIARPRLIVHGHHHHRYNGRWKGARVIGLGRDGDGPWSWATINLDTLETA